MMNIAKEIKFTADKPFVLSVRKTEKLNIMAVGLLKGQVLTKHKTQLPTTLIVLRGTILFRVNVEEIRLAAFDVYQIPIDIDHEVIGVDEENIFLLTRENLRNFDEKRH